MIEQRFMIINKKIYSFICLSVSSEEVCGSRCGSHTPIEGQEK